MVYYSFVKEIISDKEFCVNINNEFQKYSCI